MTVDTESELSVLHTLRIKGTADVDELRGRHGSGGDIEEVLGSLVGGGSVMEAGGHYALTDAGRSAHAAALDQRIGNETRAELGSQYDEVFLPLNARFKALCAEWQQSEDVELLEQLDDVHAELASFLDAGSARVPHLKGYRSRFEAALDRVMDGDSEALTGPVGDSYHNVWFELHEDLLVTLGRDRADEEG